MRESYSATPETVLADFRALRTSELEEVYNDLDEETKKEFGTLEAFKRVVRHGKLVMKQIKRMSPAMHRKLSLAARRGARRRRGRHLSPQAKRAIAKSLRARRARGL